MASSPPEICFLGPSETGPRHGPGSPKNAARVDKTRTRLRGRRLAPKLAPSYMLVTGMGIVFRPLKWGRFAPRFSAMWFSSCASRANDISSRRQPRGSCGTSQSLQPVKQAGQSCGSTSTRLGFLSTMSCPAVCRRSGSRTVEPPDCDLAGAGWCRTWDWRSSAPASHSSRSSATT